MELLHKDLTDKIIKAFYLVYNELNTGFKEHVYESALCYELESIGLHVERQKKINVFYKGMIIGTYKTDMIVEGKILIESKVQPAIIEAHEAQILHYLRATPIEVGLVLNYGPKPQFCRKVFANSRKKLNY